MAVTVKKHTMKVAIIGLGRIGKNVCLHLLEQGVQVIAYNRSRDDVDEVVAKGAVGAYSLEDILRKNNHAALDLSASPRDDNKIVVLLYVPAKVVDEVLFGNSSASSWRESYSAGRPIGSQKDAIATLQHDEAHGLIDILPTGTIIIDGGNSFFKDSQRRYQQLKTKGLHFLDMGTSGGIEGARNGACLMVGGDKQIYEQVAPLLAKISTKDGYGYVGPSGAGHFVKMIHNAVEYGMMGAIAEGLGLLAGSGKGKGESSAEFEFDLKKIAKIWAHGSIVSGHLMNMMRQALEKDPELKDLSGEVPKGETESEMEWLETLGQPMPVISAARQERVTSRKNPSFIGKVIAALRREFGGHSVVDRK